MRKWRAFIINSTVVLLLIPLMLLLATYEDVSSQIISGQSVRVEVERTYRVVSYIEMDFQKALEISGKRATITVVEFIAEEGTPLGELNPPKMANETIRDLLTSGYSNGIKEEYSKRLMSGQTLIDWLGNISFKLQKQGYEFKIGDIRISQIKAMSPRDRTNFLKNNIELTIAPLDSFRVVIRAKILNATIIDSSKKVIYTGPIPRKGYVYSIISLENLEDPIFSARTGGRYFRSIKACSPSFPELMGSPIKSVDGNGTSHDPNQDHIVGIYSSTTWDSGYIFFGDSYPGGAATGYVLRTGTLGITSAPIVVNTTLDGLPVSPREVFKDNDTGVLAFGAVGSSFHWCDLSYKWRVNITIPSFPDGSLVLLKLPVDIFPNTYHTEGQASMMIYKKSETLCTPVPFWIEYWGPSYAWIWIKASGTDYTIYFTDDSGYVTEGYLKEYLFRLIDTFDGSSGTPPNTLLWQNLGGAYLDGSGNLVVPSGEKKTVLRTVNGIEGDFFVRFKMKPQISAADFDAGVETVISTGGGTSGYFKIVVDYPNQISDVQIPIYLNSTIAQIIDHDSSNRARIEIYSDPEMTISVPFWIEYWDDGGALIWIRGDLPGTFYLKYNTGTYRRGNGDEVFDFFDDFNETLSKWIIDPYGQGATVTLDTSNEGTATINGGDSIFALRTRDELNINYDFAIRFRMKPNFNKKRDWDAGIGVWDRTDDYLGSDSDGDYYLGEQLFTDDIKGNSDPMAIHWVKWGHDLVWNTWWIEAWWYKNDDLDDIGLSSRNYDYHTYEVQEAFGKNARFIDFTRGVTNDYGGSYKTIDQPLKYIFLVIDSENKNRGAIFDWIFVHKLINYTELSYRVISGDTIQFIDDTNPSFNDHDGDLLGILRNWGNSFVSTTVPPIYTAYTYRYEVNFTPDTNSVELSFARISPSGQTEHVSTTLNVVVSSSPKIGVVIDNNNNDAYFDWIIVGNLPYHTVGPGGITSSNVENLPSSSVASYSARAYDLQPLIDCIMSHGYFGTYAGWSFFERLEGNNDHHTDYENLAHQMQDELGIKYGNEYYPIGLVSFMVPHNLYDEKLFSLINTLGLTVEEGETSVDYDFLNYYFKNGGKTTGYRVWGISYGTNTLMGNLTVIPFFLDDEAATAILGTVGAQDLLKR